MLHPLLSSSLPPWKVERESESGLGGGLFFLLFPKLSLPPRLAPLISGTRPSFQAEGQRCPSPSCGPHTRPSWCSPEVAGGLLFRRVHTHWGECLVCDVARPATTCWILRGRPQPRIRRGSPSYKSKEVKAAALYTSNSL